MRTISSLTDVLSYLTKFLTSLQVNISAAMEHEFNCATVEQMPSYPMHSYTDLCRQTTMFSLTYGDKYLALCAMLTNNDLAHLC